MKTYYGRPILKPHIWKPYIGWYFFTGGLAGTSGSLALAARAAKNRRLARVATFSAAAGAIVSSLLLVADLGNPQRFANMMRVFKPTSPMNIGTWLLLAFGASSGAAALGEVTDEALGGVGNLGRALAGILGIPLSVYTAVLISNTATPAWHHARRGLPLLFAGGSAASAGAFAALLAPHDAARAARRLALAGAAIELIGDERMQTSLGPVLAEPYHSGKGGSYHRGARFCTLTGALTMLLLGRYRPFARAAACFLLAGAIAERFCVLNAGAQSARDPRYAIELAQSNASAS
jgi:formate-dependent nitrite reductase membrane component NrfD